MSALEKLRPDRDLQCYFQRPSAIAALSATSADGFTVSGCWRQQADWAVIEWNRDNTFEHPALRYLPDGDLSGLHLSYEETRRNCIPLDSSLYPTVDWPYLRIWAEANGIEQIYRVRLADYATAVEGSYTPASATFELQGTPAIGDYIELAWLDEHHTYQLYGTDTLETAAQAIVDSVNNFSPVMKASCTGPQITLTYDVQAGANGNRIGVYANVAGTKTEKWQPTAQQLEGGTSPSRWRVDLDFGALRETGGATVPMNSVRKLRWTYAADLQAGDFVRSEFDVVVSNWVVGGTNRTYQVPGPGSHRIEDDSSELTYTGQWTEAHGNYSGGSIRFATEPGSSVRCTYQAKPAHSLYLGTRKSPNAAQVSIMIDDSPAKIVDLVLAGEDILVRLPAGIFSEGVPHTVTVTHSGETGTYFYFDFLEIAIPTETLPAFSTNPRITLATDWDTDHSIALAPERTAWLIQSLGFTGRANHYAGALRFYELTRSGHQYASGTIEFAGTPEFGTKTEIFLGPTQISHMNLIGDTPESIAKAFEQLLNAGATSVWAQADGANLAIHARAMGVEGNSITLAANTDSTTFQATVSGQTFAGGFDGEWYTDLQALPRINRAARDWSRSFFKALNSYGIDVAAAFSMELQHGDPSSSAGIAQRYPNGDPVWLNTPALQTNFSPTSASFWNQVYLDMADVMAEAGQQPFLQFGEVQWWYFPAPGAGMPFYDEFTTTSFAAAYGRPMTVFTDGQVSPTLYPQECAHLAQLIGNFTDAVMDYVRQTHPDARFEVLYPPDVNEAALNQAVNLPTDSWTPTKLDCFKTENFTYTGDRDLNKAVMSIQLPIDLGFPREKSAHLVGIGEYTAPWEKESRLSAGTVDTVVLFALDQFCLIGYPIPLNSGLRRGVYLGA